jgi:glycosyltransferase involved in cell wall biosynthesis
VIFNSRRLERVPATNPASRFRQNGNMTLADKPNFPMSTPVVSVIIPCYNTGRYLREAIDSALSQTYPAVEVIVINDGSKDDTDEIARSYGDRIVYVNQQNRGLSGARNAGIRVMKGEFVTLCDADDILLPDCIEKRLAPLLADPKVGLVAGWYREIDADGNRINRVPEKRQLRGIEPFYDVVHRNYGPPVGWTIRAEALERCGTFNPLIKLAEDWDLFLRITTKYSFAYVSDVTVLYRQLPESLSKDYIGMFDWVRKILRENEIYADSKIRYRWHGLCNQFEVGRRYIYAAATQGPPSYRIKRLVSYCVRRPQFLWIGALSFLSLLTGKRASSGRNETEMAS